MIKKIHSNIHIYDLKLCDFLMALIMTKITEFPNVCILFFFLFFNQNIYEFFCVKFLVRFKLELLEMT